MSQCSARPLGEGIRPCRPLHTPKNSVANVSHTAISDKCLRLVAYEFLDRLVDQSLLRPAWRDDPKVAAAFAAEADPLFVCPAPA